MAKKKTKTLSTIANSRSKSTPKKRVKKAPAKQSTTKTVANKTEPHSVYHKDGSLWAQGQKLNGELHGFWVWFRKDGTKLRSGTFERGEQTGEWTTYDQQGEVYKVTVMKPRPKRKPKKSS